MAAESICVQRLRHGKKTPAQKVLPARARHMRSKCSWRSWLVLTSLVYHRQTFLDQRDELILSEPLAPA